MEHIVVLGAGAGGAMTANILRRKLDRSDVRISIVDKSSDHVYQPSFYLIPFGYMEPEDQFRDVRDVMQSGVEFVEDEVVGIDPDAQEVNLDAAEDDLTYDYLVVSLGHRLAPETIPGMAEGWEQTDAVYPYYHYEAAVAMREALEDFDGGTFVVTVPDTPIKCGGAPMKMTMLAEDYFQRQGIRDDVDVVMTKPGDAIFGVSPYREKLEEIYEDRDIEFKPNFTVSEVDHENQVIHSAEGDELDYDLYAPVSPQYGQPAVTENSPLTEGDEENDGEYITVDDYTLQHTEYDNVFALGDADDTPKSRTAAAARKQAHVVADNLSSLVEGGRMTKEYSGYAACPLLTKKGKAMVAEFDYEESISAPVESRMNWIMDINVLPAFYWNAWMRGYDPLP
ncbi:NAD(P)/FAD-dependent oxidoreductase [Haloferax sp. MBLA0076]|uniref:NAD(P)/FAD-dependent oxidoreductase n=2 Tax=Haloferax litoreum TaxID=2666140 RepID=A0A6A8GFB1_9EURY|nr:FAD-dependent oxidoreductase [Haloferax sp. CBA1148]KAB1193340.1 NAD(P)/FAD-dependent oxidoreductase [Haloferax sp. CBA1148]MRX21848.1 NAD(P)/FAD-dependent oxidoreductase [Haloferax litoreum]